MDDKLFDIFSEETTGQKIKRKKQEAQGDEPTGKTGSAAWSFPLQL